MQLHKGTPLTLCMHAFAQVALTAALCTPTAPVLVLIWSVVVDEKSIEAARSPARFIVCLNWQS